MDFTALVDVAVGLAVVYLGASLFATVINEYLASLRNWRGEQLAEDLQQLIGDEGVRTELANIPAFRGLFHSSAAKNRPPSYVDAEQLAVQILRLVSKHLSEVGIDKQSGPLPAGDADKASAIFIRQQQALWLASEKHEGVYLVRLSSWIEKSLTSMGETYKRKLQTSSLFVGLLLAVLFNLNTIAIVDHLWHDKESRSALALIGVDAASALTPQQITRCTRATADTVMKDSASAGQDSTAVGECAVVRSVMQLVAARSEEATRLPIGWARLSFSISTLPGWFLTALAISLGATFWFDILKRLVNVRHGMKKPEG